MKNGARGRRPRVVRGKRRLSVPLACEHLGTAKGALVLMRDVFRADGEVDLRRRAEHLMAQVDGLLDAVCVTEVGLGRW